ncbi:unnamed protein product [Clonostachys rosea f. rosea IK726]|uniref:Uncharacterized protein n=1 Tax=Clonostachys rosea f. rosea IK726 TaxID=1349383 RepID=A0ACA9UAZ2_BIOOC|nr:unnamed protein product [Clonostachys rosea f. rosea IK726]
MPSPVTGITASDSSYAFEGINIPDRLHAPCSADDGTNDTVRTDQHVDLSSSIDKKPILKKRSISERILEESYVGAATPYQGKDGRSRITRPASGCLVSRGNSGTTSSTTYGVSYRSWKRKCVHFNEQVDHFIVITMPTATQMIPRTVAVSLQHPPFFVDDFAALFTDLGGQADIQWGREQAATLDLLQQSPAPSAVLITDAALTQRSSDMHVLEAILSYVR